MTEIKFEGEPPFTLPAAQGVAAAGQNGLVVVTFYVVAPPHGLGPFSVEITMDQSIADYLVTQLSKAAADAAKE